MDLDWLEGGARSSTDYDSSPLQSWLLSNNPSLSEDLASFFTHLNWSLNATDAASIELNDVSAVRLGLATGFVLTLLSRIRLEKILSIRAVFAILLLIFIGIVPFLIVVMLTCALYRGGVHIYLKLTRSNYCVLMRGMDAVWALENSKSLSAINILVIMKGKPDIDKLRVVVQDRLLLNRASKLLQRYTYRLGYFCWENVRNFKIEDHIREMHIDVEMITEDDLKMLVGRLSNTPFSRKTSPWEILIGPPLHKTDGAEERYPVLLRIHHSIGDGVALLRLFLMPLTDHASDLRIINKLIEKNNQVPIIQRVLVVMKSIILTPVVLYHQASRYDSNLLHGPQLSGYKIVSWTQPIEKKTVKRIQAKTGSKLSDILLTALSASLEWYFLQHGSSHVPHHVTAVIPALMPSSCLPQELKNDFTLALLTLPVAVGANFRKRLQHVQSQTTLLRTAPDFQINFWLLNTLATSVPFPLLRPMLQKSHSTLVISNLPGPEECLTVGGDMIENITFFVPNRGHTGVGFTILGYASKLHVGIIADRALIACQRDAEVILERFVKEVKAMASD